MDIFLVVLNSIIRPRHRRLYLQGCVILLLLIIFTIFLLTFKTRTFRSNKVSERSIVKANNASLCVTLDIPMATSSDVNSSRITTHKHSHVPTIFAITPTKKRLTQLLDLTSLCQTLMNVENLVWIVVERVKTIVVSNLLDDCQVKTVHLSSRVYHAPSVKSQYTIELSALKYGVGEVNIGLGWLRHYCNTTGNCSGAVYFLDDESKYDLRLFQEIRQVKYVGIWPVAYAGRIKFEGPVCVNRTEMEWHVLYMPTRPFPINRLGFAVNVQCLLDHPHVIFGFAPKSIVKSNYGWEESDFLRNFLLDRLDPRLECRGSAKEAYVWHVKSEIDPYLRKHSHHWKYKLRT